MAEKNLIVACANICYWFIYDICHLFRESSWFKHIFFIRECSIGTVNFESMAI